MSFQNSLSAVQTFQHNQFVLLIVQYRPLEIKLRMLQNIFLSFNRNLFCECFALLLFYVLFCFALLFLFAFNSNGLIAIFL